MRYIEDGYVSHNILTVHLKMMTLLNTKHPMMFEYS